jgi:hypothetical protein
MLMLVSKVETKLPNSLLPTIPDTIQFDGRSIMFISSPTFLVRCVIGKVKTCCIEKVNKLKIQQFF